MIGRPHAHHRLTDSTNERAKALALAGAAHGTMVTADAQTAGRGRQGREWAAAPRSAVLMSLVLREVGPLLPLAAAVAVCEASESLAPVECRVKWPNDIWVEERKLAGILVEGRGEGWAVLGIGLNVLTEEFPPELEETATSLALAAPEAGVQPAAMLQGLLEALSRRLSDREAETLEAWRERDALRGGSVRWAGGEGTAAGIDDSGALLVDGDGERLALPAGEVHLVRPS
jgi:BirA family transcriptional regulator, biotin operon repressor / biotin---[acetyl-CoA-carboxylase] ligase